MYDARPDIQRQFPDGVTQFAQIAAQLGEDFWDNLVPQMVDGAGAGGGGGMPGQFAVDDDEELEEDVERPGNTSDGDDVEDVVEDEEGSEGEEEAAPVRLFFRFDARPVHHSALVSTVPRFEYFTNVPILQTFPVRVWQNLVNRVWGGAEPADGAQRPNGGGQN